MGTNARKLLAGSAVGALTVGTFALGMHLAPDSHAGQNLAQAQAPLLGHNSSAKPVTYASLRTAANQPPKSTDGPVAPQETVPDSSAMDGPGTTFQQVYLLLKRNYVDGVPSDKVMGHGAASAMLNSLQDPDSRFLEEAEMSELQSETKGLYHGAGVVTSVRKIVHPKNETPDSPEYNEYQLTVVSALPGSPADKEGVKSGDVITDMDGHWLAGYDPVIGQTKALKAAQDDPVAFNKLATAIQKKIDGAYSMTKAQTVLDDATLKTVALTITRSGTPKPLTVTLDTTEPTQVTSVAGRSLPGNIAYIKVAQFSAGADKDFNTTLDGFGTDVKGLILDLRNCPGGLIDVGAAIGSRLSNLPNLGYLETRGKKMTPIGMPSGQGVAYPIVVLVDGGTANSAELLAAALQARGSKLVGVKTFGDAVAVKTIALRDGSGFTMTIGHLYTADHKDFASKGVKPDIDASASASPDDVINQAVGVLSGRVAGNPSTRG